MSILILDGELGIKTHFVSITKKIKLYTNSTYFHIHIPNQNQAYIILENFMSCIIGRKIKLNMVAGSSKKMNIYKSGISILIKFGETCRFKS